MQSSFRLWCAKRTRIVWSHIFLGPRFCWPAPSSHAVSYFLFFCFYRVSIEQIASNFIYLLQHGDFLDEICFWTFPLLFISTLLPIRVDWFVNSIKLKSWIEATYLSSSLTRQVSRTDRCQNEMESLVSLNLPSHFALIHQSTYLSGADNFAVIIIALTSFENDYTGWLAHSRSTRGICLKRLVKWSLFY